MQILIGKYSGYCPGVKRAIKMLDKEVLSLKTSTSGNHIYTLGEIIHNPGVNKSYTKKGIKILNDIKEINSLDSNTVVIRSHGVSPAVKKELETLNINIVDATCPFVVKAQKIAKELNDTGYFIVLLGERNHPEVDGIAGNMKPDNYIIVENKHEIKDFPGKRKVAMLSQTTQTIKNFNSVSQKLSSLFDYEFRIFKTICKTTILRQKEALELATKSDVVIVVGGRNSANTRHLSELALTVQKNTYQVENGDEVEKKWFKNTDKVAIISGASTPYSDLENIRVKIERFF